MAKMKPMGDVTHDLEKVLDQMIIQHDLEKGEVLNLISGFIDVHYPDSKEVYEDGTGSPVFYYGPRKGLKDG